MSTTGDAAAEVQEAARPRPLLHPRLVLLDPALDAAGLRRAPAGQGRTLRGRLRVVASTVGACLTLAFAAHALEVAAPHLTASTTSETAPAARQ